jgi:hypothetical protein
MFHMTNDSRLFWTHERLENEGAYAVELGRWRKGEQEWVPLYEGKMINFFDHRCAEVDVDEERLFRPGQPSAIALVEKQNPNFVLPGRYFVEKDQVARQQLRLGSVL